MKNALKKAAVFLTGISLLLNLCIPILAATQSAPQMTLTLDKTSVARGGEIAVTVSVDPATTVGGGFDISFDNLEYVRYEKTDDIKAIYDDPPSQQESEYVRCMLVMSNNKTPITDLGTYYFRIPETAALGEYSISVSSAYAYDSSSQTVNATCDPVTFTVVEEEEEAETAQGWQAALSGPTTATPGTEITYSITVTGNSFSAAQLELTYDSSLSPTSTDDAWNFDNGTATLVQYGQTPTMPYTYSLNMQTADTEGSATVTLTYAAFGTSESAVASDLTAATISGSPVTTAIHKSSYSVTFQGDAGISHKGSGTVAYGGDYTFTIIDADKAYYNYTVTATMGGTEVEVTDGKDGSYTIPNVTGELVITIARTARQYPVTFEKAHDSMNITLPNDGTATYGTDYTYHTLPTEDGYTLGVSVTIDNVDYKDYKLTDNELTIPGTAIKGEIVITVRRTTVPVSVTGSGAEDVVDFVDTAIVGKSYTLTVTQDSNYDYSVTATAGSSKTTVTNNEDGTYTVQKVTDAGELVFTVNKSVKTNDVSVTEYIKLNSNSCWLVIKQCEQLTNGAYAYQNQTMFWSDEYEGYCYLVISTGEPTVSGDDLSIINDKATEIKYDGDVNMTKKIDANDAQLVYDLYNATYGDFTKVSMEKFLRADVNGDKCVNTTDAAAVVSMILSGN